MEWRPLFIVSKSTVRFLPFGKLGLPIICAYRSISAPHALHRETIDPLRYAPLLEVSHPNYAARRCVSANGADICPFRTGPPMGPPLYAPLTDDQAVSVDTNWRPA